MLICLPSPPTALITESILEPPTPQPSYSAVRHQTVRSFWQKVIHPMNFSCYEDWSRYCDCSGFVAGVSDNECK